MKTHIEHSCGHDSIADLVGPNTHGQRQRKADWLATRPCPACARQQETDECATQNAETAQDAEAQGWPELTGTPKQISWATALRAQTIAAMAERLADKLTPETTERALELWTAGALRATDAAWWIDHRDRPQAAVNSLLLTPDELQTLRDLHDQEPATPPTPQQPQDLEDTQRALNSYGQTRDRLKAAGQRAADAETARRAAIADMGAAVRDHKALLATLGRTSPKIGMDDAQELTGLSRRTLSEAASTPPTSEADRELAARYRDYGYDLEEGGDELHRRYPRLAGLYEARMLLWREQTERWEAEHPDELFQPDLGVPAGVDCLEREYRRQVDAIAGQPPA